MNIFPLTQLPLYRFLIKMVHKLLVPKMFSHPNGRHPNVEYLPQFITKTSILNWDHWKLALILSYMSVHTHTHTHLHAHTCPHIQSCTHTHIQSHTHRHTTIVTH